MSSLSLRRTFAALLSVFAVLVAPMLTAPSSVSAQGDMTEITIAVPNPSCLIFYPLHVAIQEGYYKDRGLDVTVEAVDGSAPVLQAMAGGQAQVGAPGPGPVLNARARGEDIVYFYNLYPRGLFGLAVREESDYQTPEDLKGMTIGVGTADGAEVSLARTIFTNLGFEEGTDFEFLPVGDGGQAAAAFERGDIEAYMAAVSDMAILNSVGVAVRDITPSDYLYFMGNGLAATGEFLQENPDAIVTIGQGMAWATEWGMENKDQVIADCAEVNPQEAEDTELASALYEAATAQMQPVAADSATPAASGAGGWGYMPPENWEKIMEDLVAAGELDEPIDVTQAYTNDYVDQYQDFGQ